jgi:hypothetical protein
LSCFGFDGVQESELLFDGANLPKYCHCR